MEYRRVEVVGSGMQREGVRGGKAQVGKGYRSVARHPERGGPVKICFVGNLNSSFVRQDCEILKKRFEVDAVQIPKSEKDLLGYLKLFFKIRKSVKLSDVSFSWFSDKHSAFAVFFSKKYGKKSIVVVGGYDVANVPEIKYGAFCGIYNYLKQGMWSKYVLKNADRVLVVDPSLKRDAIKNANVDGKNIECLPTGYDSDYWKAEGKKENIVLTVGGISDSVVKRKGFETFVKAAKYLPDVKFALIGKHMDDSIDYLKSIAPPNVEFTGFVSNEDLLRWYQKAKIYCQLSRYEGLPNALCEAMLCECIPVGTKYCGIPTAMDGAGFYVPYGDEKATAESIKKALGASDDLGKKARERIKTVFSIERREKELIKVIE